MRHRAEQLLERLGLGRQPPAQGAGSSPAANSSGWPSPGPWSMRRRSSSPTSRPPTSTASWPAELLEILTGLHAEGKTIVIATHDRFVFDHPLISRVVAMRDGAGPGGAVILHPGILALLTGTGLVLLLCLYASATGGPASCAAGTSSSSELQYQLERRTYLVSTLVRYALGFEILSGLLFIYTSTTSIPSSSAPCAPPAPSTPTRSAGTPFTSKSPSFSPPPSGWCSTASTSRPRTFPWCVSSTALLLLVTYLVALDFYYQLRYFLGLSRRSSPPAAAPSSAPRAAVWPGGCRGCRRSRRCSPSTAAAPCSALLSGSLTLLASAAAGPVDPGRGRLLFRLHRRHHLLHLPLHLPDADPPLSLRHPSGALRTSSAIPST